MPRKAEKSEVRIAFGKRLREILAEKGWSQADLARRASTLLPDPGRDIGRDMISNYINGVTLPRADSLHAIAKALDMSPKDLLSDEAPIIARAVGSGRPLTDRRLLRVEEVGDGTVLVAFNRVLPGPVADRVVAALVKALGDTQ